MFWVISESLALPSALVTTSVSFRVTASVSWPRKMIPATVMIKNKIGPIDEMA